MKKIICVLLLLAGFSAFAINPTRCSKTQKTPVKKDVQKKHTSLPAPLADLVLFPNGI